MKLIRNILMLFIVVVAVIAAVGVYKFNYLANLEGYDADGNKINAEQVNKPENNNNTLPD